MADAERDKLLEIIASQQAEIERLKQIVDALTRRLFGSKSEALDPAQLELLLDPDAAKKAPAADPAEAGPAADEKVVSFAAGPKRERRPRDLSHLEVRESVDIPAPVQVCPEAYREMGRTHTDRLGYQPSKRFIERTIRPVFVRRGDPDAVPLKALAPASLRPGLSATPGLLAHVLVSKYVDHLPFYRQQAIFDRRHGVNLDRSTLCRWTDIAADALEPLYKLIHAGLLEKDYLQADETPVKYLDPGKGKTSTGYLWVLHAPRCGEKGDILFQWHPGRRAASLDELIGGRFTGNLQCDAYAAYISWTAGKQHIHLSACWAHARRKFEEALKVGETLAAAPLHTIQKLYRIEKKLRETRAGPDERRRLRQQHALPILDAFKPDLITLRQHPHVLPRNKLAAAIGYTLALWDKLLIYLQNGHLEIDTNLIENGIRPTAVGKRNWLFFGGETTGQRSAIIYTLVECARRHGHNPEAYLPDVLGRLPRMTNQDDLGALLPSRWQDPTTAATEATRCA
jgi:transposase